MLNAVNIFHLQVNVSVDHIFGEYATAGQELTVSFQGFQSFSGSKLTVIVCRLQALRERCSLGFQGFAGRKSPVIVYRLYALQKQGVQDFKGFLARKLPIIVGRLWARFSLASKASWAKC